ncbi:MAG TPA: hypothetical protein VIU85_09865 [Chthoniobacterales bacterium]
MKATARFLIVAVTIFAWFAISNHCAIRAVAAKAEKTQSSCPFHSKPAKPSEKSNATECCKVLRAVPTSPTPELTPKIFDLLPLPTEFHQLAILGPPKISLEPATLDTGPPGKTSFAELNRSMRAHAPPSVA